MITHPTGTLTEPAYDRVRVGVGVALLMPSGYLLLRRTGKHGAGEWSLPGGALEPGETAEACAARECLEETGLSIHSMSLIPFVSQDFFPEFRQHWITLYVLARAEGEPLLMEPDKASAIMTAGIGDFPSPLFCGLPALLASGLLGRI